MVHRLYAKGRSLRGIAEDLALSLQTVRTILDKDVYLDRGSRKILERIAPDHLREKLDRAKQAGRRTLQKQINAWLKDVDWAPQAVTENRRAQLDPD